MSPRQGRLLSVFDILEVASDLGASGLGTKTRISVEEGSVRRAGAFAAALGKHALVVTGRSTARAAGLSASLEAAHVRVTIFPVDAEPTIEDVRTGVAAARAAGCDVVIGLGGGSALDAAKAIAVLVGHEGDVLDHLEIVGSGLPLERRGLEMIAIPTTAGTGSEVTKNAVLVSPAHGVKASLRSPFMVPALALIDPDLLANVPAPVVASSGLDALSQLIEPYLSTRATPLTDRLARDGIARSAGALGPAFEAARAGRELPPGHRRDLALASLCGGLCLANAGLGAVHGFAAPLGGMFSAPHGAVCAALLPAVLSVNARALAARDAASPALPRLREIAVLVTGRADATLDDGVAWIADLCAALEIPGLARHGLTPARIPELIAKARVASSMKANPIALTDADLTEIATASL